MKGGENVLKKSIKDLYLNDLNVVDKNDYSYCVDMLRLKTDISINDFEKKIKSRLFIYKPLLEMWTSSKLGEFYYNYKFADNDCSFWFGFIANNKADSLQNADKMRNLTVEFNPNKVKSNQLLLDILSVSKQWTIKSLDFALDVKTNILNLCGFDKQRKSFFKTIDNGLSDRTYYMGVKNNRVKIYNKKIESNLDILDLTRIEITKYLDLDLLDVRNFEFGYFPELFLNEYQLSFTDIQKNANLSVLIFAVNHGYLIHDLSKYDREKVKAHLKQKKPIDIDFSCFSSALTNYLNYYFHAYNI